MRRFPPIRRRLLALGLSFCALLVPARSDSAARQQKRAEPEPAPNALASGIATGADPGTIRSGSLRLTHAEQGPALAIEDLELDPDVRPPVEAVGTRPAFTGDCMVISEFDFTTRNRLGGGFRAFQQAPSLATASLHRDATGRRALRLTIDRRGSGFAGMSLGLHASEPVNGRRYFLDARDLGSVVLWVRVHAGDPMLRVAFADREAAVRGDADEIGTLARFVPGGQLGGEWQRAIIPLDRLDAATDRRQLAKLVLIAAPASSGSLDIDRPALCRPHATSLPALTPRWNKEAAASDPGLWVWHTREIVASPTRQRDLARLVARQGIGTVYLQLPGEILRDPPDLETAAAELEPLARSLGAAGAQVLALDGAPQYARTESHQDVVDVVDRIRRLNDLMAPAARFTGVHYDIEPYLLEEFGDARRDALVSDYLLLLERLHEATVAAGLDLEVAIPFWFDGIRVERADGVRPLSELVIDRVDRATIMDYRTESAGSNGTVALAEQELVYASQVGKPVRIGLETTDLPDEELIYFRGDGTKGLPHHPGKDGFVVAGLDGDRLRLVLIAPGAEPRQQLGELIHRLQGARTWEVAGRQNLAASRLTFADLGAEALHRVMQETAADLTRVPAFAGFAIHYYRPYAALLQAAAGNADRERP